MKTVCIVGAGPAGLAAAKTFIRTGKFTVTVYEKDYRIGGIWALDEDTTDGFLSPQTPTNLSRFTVSFSDLDWNEVDLRSRRGDALPDGSKSPHVPMFPKAWQVNRYLEEYCRRYVPEETLVFEREVIETAQCKTLADSAKPFWRVTTTDRQSRTETKEFDYLVVASGFFSTPRTPRYGSGSMNGDLRSATRAVHSSQFRTLNDLFPDDENAVRKSVLMTGGGNSSGETAAAIAMQLSDAQWSPNRARRKQYEGCRVIHVTPRPLYALPPFLEYEKGSRTFVPVDFKLYDFSRRPPMDSYGGPQSPEVRDMVHGAIQTWVGGDQSDLGSDALTPPAKCDQRGTAYVALAESYSEYVRNGLIEVRAGRVTHVRATETGVVATVQNGDETFAITDVAAEVYATGYTPSTALDFLADDVKRALQYDPNSTRLPLILEQWQTVHKAVPTIAFLGFYEGPFWPMIEMQARLTAERWSNESQHAPQRPYEDAEKLQQLRKTMHDKALDIPQYWFNDYLGYVEDVAKHLNLDRNDGPFQEREGCQSPARHLSSQDDHTQANAIVKDLHQTWRDCIDKGKYMARAAFRALQGKWNIHRGIASSHAAFSGTFTGQASFHPRFPTKDRSGKSFDLEYLYIESGTFKSTHGDMTMTASRRYVYRYSEAADELSVWFIKPDNDLEVDYLFHNLTFVPPAEARKAGACIAKADHLCVEDMYWTQYTLPMEAIVLRQFEIRHTVKGTGKDYVATAQYSRPAKDAKVN